jgi:hypothetical protein
MSILQTAGAGNGSFSSLSFPRRTVCAGPPGPGQSPFATAPGHTAWHTHGPQFALGLRIVRVPVLHVPPGARPDHRRPRIVEETCWKNNAILERSCLNFFTSGSVELVGFSLGRSPAVWRHSKPGTHSPSRRNPVGLRCRGENRSVRDQRQQAFRVGCLRCYVRYRQQARSVLNSRTPGPFIGLIECETRSFANCRLTVSLAPRRGRVSNPEIGVRNVMPSTG